MIGLRRDNGRAKKDGSCGVWGFRMGRQFK